MIHLIIIVAFLTVGIILLARDENFDNTGPFGFFIVIIFGLSLLLHIGYWASASYRYQQWRTKRDAFELTLHNARKNGNQYEIATIVRDVAEWNQSLAEAKYDNSTFFFEPYVDNRIEKLKPIK